MSEAGPLASFSFRTSVGAFCEIPTEIARALLPGDLQPVELHHGSAVLSSMAFDFQDTPFGDYREVVLGIAVAPRVDAGGAMPRSAFFPFALATTSRDARLFASQHLHLPYHPDELDIALTETDGELEVLVQEGDNPVLEMRVTEHDWHPVDHAYQSFMRDDSGLWAADIRIQASFSENEDSRGVLVLHEHALTAGLPAADVDESPFREQWMRGGRQTFEQLRQVTGPGR